MSEISFKEFMEQALYDPRTGYYAGRGIGPSKAADYVTSPLISPAFSFAVAALFREFVDRTGGGLSAILDIGCGDGTLLRQLRSQLGPDVRLTGVDRAARVTAGEDAFELVSTIDGLDPATQWLVIANELYDAFPVSRVVQRGTLRELFVDVDALEWREHEAPDSLKRYFEARDVRLEEGQYADVALEWADAHRRIVRRFPSAMFLIFDYGYETKALFDVRARRYGTIAAYSKQTVHRDVLSRKGEQDLTAHVNFSDLIEAGSLEGAETLAFERQASMLMKFGILEHPDLRPADEEREEDLAGALARNEEREAARRLILPAGIGEEMRVLIQARGIPMSGWSFQKKRGFDRRS